MLCYNNHDLLGLEQFITLIDCVVLSLSRRYNKFRPGFPDQFLRGRKLQPGRNDIYSRNQLWALRKLCCGCLSLVGRRNSLDSLLKDKKKQLRKSIFMNESIGVDELLI